MSEAVVKLFQDGGGQFVTPPSVFIQKLNKIKAVVFDWDGVFNDGFKSGSDGSIFSEVDAMGSNLLRFTLWKRSGSLPITAVVTGENNPPAQALAQREHFHELYFLSKNKAAVLKAFCAKHNLSPDEVLFFFDDVLDIEMARQSGLRIMIGRTASPMLKSYAKENNVADYISAHDGGHHGVREGCELIIGLTGKFDEVVKDRSTFNESYKTYLAARQSVETAIIQATPFT